MPLKYKKRVAFKRTVRGRPRKTYKKRRVAAGVRGPRLSGSGAYHLSSGGTSSQASIARFSSGKDYHSTVVEMREFLGDVSGSIGFSINEFVINPGNAEMFPWLSQQANSYEMYQFLSLVVQYRPTSGAAISGTNSALGSVIMTTEYNAASPAFTDKASMVNNEGTTSGAPSMALVHGVECAKGSGLLKNLFIRQNNASVPNTDRRLFDMGKFYLATQGMQAANVVGELWVTYRVRLLKPQTSTLFAPADEVRYALVATATGAMLGTSQVLMTGQVFDRLRPEMISMTSTVLTITGMPVGTIFEVIRHYHGSTAAVWTYSASSGTGLVTYNGFPGSSAAAATGTASTAVDGGPASGTSTNVGTIVECYESTASTVAITVGCSGPPTNNPYGFLCVRVWKPQA